jgi:hypothetical protein
MNLLEGFKDENTRETERRDFSLLNYEHIDKVNAYWLKSRSIVHCYINHLR